MHEQLMQKISMCKLSPMIGIHFEAKIKSSVENLSAGVDLLCSKIISKRKCSKCSTWKINEMLKSRQQAKLTDGSKYRGERYYSSET